MPREGGPVTVSSPLGANYVPLPAPCQCLSGWLPVCSCRLAQLQIEPSMESSLGASARRSGLLFEVWARIRTAPFWIASIALVLRIGWIVIGHTYKFKSTDDNFGFGWEMGRVAASLASGHGFSNPFGPPTGPTAWEPPLYPYLIAAVFLLFGIYSKEIG